MVMVDYPRRGPNRSGLSGRPFDAKIAERLAEIDRRLAEIETKLDRLIRAIGNLQGDDQP
jgi:hypothetical protein